MRNLFYIAKLHTLIIILIINCGLLTSCVGSPDLNDENFTGEITVPVTDEKNVSDEILLSEEEIYEILDKWSEGIEVTDMNFRLDDGIAEYEGLGVVDGKQIEFEVHAYTGIILEWEILK